MIHTKTCYKCHNSKYLVAKKHQMLNYEMILHECFDKKLCNTRVKEQQSNINKPVFNLI